MKEKIVIIGCGGQGKVTLDILNLQNKEVIGFIDDDIKKHNTFINDVRILGDINFLLSNKITKNVSIAIGDNKIRAKIFNLLKENNFNIINVIHPNTTISNTVKLGQGLTIMPGAIINTNTIIEDNVIINTNSSVDHDCIIKKHSQIQPGATITGTVKIEEYTTIGSGATILPNLKIGKNSFVGAGAVVTKNVADNLTVVGVPAKILGEK